MNIQSLMYVYYFGLFWGTSLSFDFHPIIQSSQTHLRMLTCSTFTLFIYNNKGRFLLLSGHAEDLIYG